jgi:hypothetical protein
VTLTVWDFENGLSACSVSYANKGSVPVKTISSLDKVVRHGQYWWEPWKRCGCCKKEFDGESLAIVTEEDILIPCYSCETIIRVGLEE